MQYLSLIHAAVRSAFQALFAHWPGSASVWSLTAVFYPVCMNQRFPP